ncbi:MAG: hypothetical protein A2Y24_07565 [Clostridiales bacterium GWE2_32_10]|nr:MAG: hypothetical protein A2Y24_07565 [Clostridiales bacterium GWE2_32_10]HBY20567.1 hypothetical protein [Clostridiales bacterium]
MNVNSTLTVYHASINIVKDPKWNYVLHTKEEYKTSDFGVGFYTSTDTEQPIKLLCSNERGIRV